MLRSVILPLIEDGENIECVNVMRQPFEADRHDVKFLPTTVISYPGERRMSIRREGYVSTDELLDLLEADHEG